MSGLPKQLVDPFKQASLETEFCGELSLDKMPRIEALLAVKNEGSLSYQLRFSQPGRRKYRLEGQIEATLSLPCQRCFRPSRHEVSSQFRFAFVETEAESALVNDDAEPLIVEEDRISLVALLEDELLLSMPSIAVHEDIAECQGSDWQHWTDKEATKELIPDTAKENNPFAVLADLKKN